MASVSHTRPKAFSLVEYVLYVFAIFVLLQQIGDVLGNAGAPIGALLFLAAVFGFVLTVFARNYMVMHAIDNRDRHKSKEFSFLSVNYGMSDRFERIFRALIVFLVVITPKDIFRPFSVPLRDLSINVASYWSDTLDGFSPIGYKSPGWFPLLTYYGFVLFILFGMFLVWDLINVLSFRSYLKRTLAGKVNNLDDISCNPELYSIIEYMNIVSDSKRGRLGIPTYLPRFEQSVVSELNNGRLFRLYLRSPKCYERLAGLLVSASIVFTAITSIDALSSFLFGVSAFFYFVCASANERYLTVLFEFPVFWWKYLAIARSKADTPTPGSTSEAVPQSAAVQG